MASYTYTLAAAKQYDLTGLQTQAAAAGLPIDYINGSPGVDQITVFTTRDLTAPEQSTLATLVANYDGRPRRARTLLAIVTDLSALTSTQKSNVSGALFSPTNAPPILADAGANAAAIWALYAMVQLNGVTTADKNTIKLYAAAQYVQDNPAYLVNPSFDSSINIRGDAPYDP